eukprot:g17566.t1
MIQMKRDFRAAASGLALIALAACQPAVPDSGAGVGFDNYSQYQRQREAQLSGQASALPPAAAVSSETLPGSGTGAVASTATPSEAESLAADTRAALNAANSNSGVAPLEASPSNPAPVAVNTVGISQENDFNAVDEQRSIAADKALIEQNKANYTQVQPEALPTRTDTGPNIVAYALQTRHPVGQQIHRRTNLPGAEGRYQRVCASFPSPDLAQTEFLKAGGPDRDRRGMDPDGDGYACSWDPRPFRKAAGG